MVALGEIKGISLPDNDDMLVWTLKDIEPGDYYIGLVASFTRDTVFLNGRALQFETGSEPYLDERGTPRLREWVTAKPIALTNGDQIRVNGMSEVVRLNLYRNKPPRGMVNCDRTTPIPDFYRFNATLQAADGNQIEGKYSIRNVQGKSDKIMLNAELVDYEQRILWKNTEEITLQSFERSKEVSFKIPRGDTWLYRLKIVAKGTDGKEQLWTVSCMTDVENGVRRRIWLSGNNWEIAAQATKLKELDYADKRKEPVKSVTVPGGFPPALKNTFEHVAWYRREFTIEPKKDELYFLHFERVEYECEVYVNGQKAGAHYGPNSPFALDITPLLKNGVNVLEVGVRDYLAALPKSVLDKVETGKPVDMSWLKAPKLLGYEAGIFDDVYLETRPSMNLSDMRVICDYPSSRVDTRFQISSKAGSEKKVKVAQQIFHEGKQVFTFPEKELELKADGPTDVDMSAVWDNPILWQLENPRLCVLVTTLRDGDKVVDELRTRFGFAHWRTEGNKPCA